MTVRAMTNEDIGKIAALEKRCFSDPWNEDAFSSSLRVPFFIGMVVEEAGAIVAYSCLSVVCEDAEILNIAVAPEYRKRGYGRLLLERMLSVAREKGATQCFLEVRKSNALAIGLYSAFGFERYGVRQRYYGDGEDALAMKVML